MNIETYKTLKNFILCPICRHKHYFLHVVNEKYLCINCEYSFDFDKAEGLWEEESVDTINCDICRMELTCTSDNFLTGFPPPSVAIGCPICNDAKGDHHLHSHLVGIKYRNKWWPPTFFLHQKGKDGFHKIKGIRSKITFCILLGEAKSEKNIFFLTPSNMDWIKLLWVNGDAVGYYMSNLVHLKDAPDEPCLRQIYVRQSFRGMGNATKMILDFLNNNEGHVCIESPNEPILSILHKLDLLEKIANGKYRSKGRISFVYCG